MIDRVKALQEDYASLLEMHGEYAEMLEGGSIEARELWEEIEELLKDVTRIIRRIDGQRTVDEEILDELDEQMSELNDQYGEFAALA